MKPGTNAPALVLVLVLACCTCGCRSKVRYGDATAVETVTEDFGSTDLQMIAKKMVDSLLTSPAIRQSHRPVLLVSSIKNKTAEHIDTKAITDKIRTTLIQSGKVQFTAAETRPEIADELAYQRDSGYVDQATRKEAGRQVGADFLLTGEITSITKERDRLKDVYYKITMNLVNLETGLIDWAEEKEIRKDRKRPLVGW